MKPASRILLVQPAPLEAAAAIMREAAQWLIQRDEPLWNLEDLALDKLQARCEPGDVFIGSIAGDPAVAALVQKSDRFLWPDDRQALYIHKLSVRRSYAGRGLPAQLLTWAASHARASGRKFLRLDCDATRPKLCAFYEQQGFIRVDTRNFGPFHLALYEKCVSSKLTRPPSPA